MFGFKGKVEEKMENENRTAERILSGKDSYFMAIKERYGEDVSDKVRTEAARLLDEYLSTHDPLPRPQAIHVEDNIIPTAYIYGVLKGIVGVEALELMKKIKADAARETGYELNGKLLARGKEAFFRWWEQYCRDTYSDGNGFHSIHYSAKEDGVSLDVLKCPYCEILASMGIPELIPAFCESDNESYGHLDGVRFVRKGTLGMGMDRCDFRLETAED